MLDLKRIRKDFDQVKSLIELRGKGDFELSRIIDLDEKRRTLLTKVEEMRNQQNTISKQIPVLKKEKKDTSQIMSKMKLMSHTIKEDDERIKAIDEEMRALLLSIPNIPKSDTPIGISEEDNLEIKKIGEIPCFSFEPKAHWDLGTDLDIIDFERATKITGTRFNVLKKDGAKLERALINFMLDLHTEKHGYEEVMPPFMVNRNAMIGTGQLPKFEEDMFHLPSKDFFLIPTAEVPVTNLYSNEILLQEQLPIYHTAYTPCFRKEAGSAGRDTRGLIRVHQFNKVELVKFSHPDESYAELESLLLDAEEVLRQLKLPYRVVRLCSGDLTFASAKTYDIEVWMPSYGRYLEISSCSNFEDFQARRANIKFRDQVTKKVRFVHTLNGSGLAIGRTFAAILENYQNGDGSIRIPEVLMPYMNGKAVIK
ncbi:MAG: serine--tRNA ligase [Clostridia bacterium]|nr:serine--tRNA ligase [Clostridia bacterium]